MRAASLKSGTIYVKEDAPEPVPTFGTVLVQVKACGICGSDLHFAKHGAQMLALGQQMGGMPAMGEGPQLDLDQDVYMGHEFCAEVLEIGSRHGGTATGQLASRSIPVLLTNLQIYSALPELPRASPPVNTNAPTSGAPVT